MTILLQLILSLAFASRFSGVFGANCASYDTNKTCSTVSGCLWSQDETSCLCGSNVTIDIVFALDSSKSISTTYFQIELDWLSDFVSTSLSQNSRVGIINFALYSYMILNFSESETMSTAELASFVEHNITYNGNDGIGTNTVDAIKQTLLLFEKESYDYATKVLIIVTDGNPCCTKLGMDVDVCAWASDLKSDEISTYIIGVGNNWQPENVDCLVDDEDEDIIFVTSFNYSQFDEILPTLSDITCPVTYTTVITEVKIESDGTDGRTVPFLEFYNPSNDITLSDLTLEGYITGSPYPTSNEDATLPQGYYLVLYDGTFSDGGANVTCDECDCDKRGNDYCQKAIYIACDGTNCAFDDSYSNGDWYIEILDSDGSTLDSVTYDSTFPNLTLLIGYSFELQNKGYDNDEGSNWDPSCNIYGSPGSGPLTNCTYTCTNTLCQAGGAKNAFVDSKDTTVCDCDEAKHYYQDGCSCVLVPPPGDCVVYWVKNLTNLGIERYEKFIWDRSSTDLDHQYRLGYPVSGSYQYYTLYPRYKIVTDFDTSIGADATAGTVQTVMYSTYSEKVNCTSITMSPSMEPTQSPSVEPSPGPTENPSPAPTFSNPYLFIGGDICDQDRCDCYGMSLTCTDDDIQIKWTEASTEYVTVEQRPINFAYPTLIYYYVVHIGGSNSSDEDTDEDTQRRRMRAMKNILDANGMKSNLDDIEFVGASGSHRSLFSMNSSYGENGTMINGTDDDGFGITPEWGFANISIKYSDAAETDISGNYGSIKFTVGDAVSDDSDFEMFKVVIHNCTVQGDEGIGDLYSCDVVYPSELYIIIEQTDNSATNLTETEFPAWLWWLIIGLVLFLFILVWLVYRYWWKNRAAKSALVETENELEDAIAEDELGFANDLGTGHIGFNPLAAGAPNIDNTMPNGGGNLNNNANGFGNDKADVAIDKFSSKMEFGQVAPKRRPGGNDLSEPLL